MTTKIVFQKKLWIWIIKVLLEIYKHSLGKFRVYSFEDEGRKLIKELE